MNGTVTKDLRMMFDRYWAGCETDALDPDILAENVMWTWRDEEELLAPFLADVADLRRRIDGLSPEDQALVVGVDCPLPAGRTWDDWLRYLAEHVAEFYPHRRRHLLALDDGMRLPRVSKFTDGRTADQATTQVLGLHDELVRHWSAGDDGTQRLHLYADLGHPVGWYSTGAGAPAARDGGREARPAVKQPATGCVVLLRRDPLTGRAFVGNAYPERSLDEGVRERFPDLPSLFGCHFGQDWDELDTNLWAAERNFNTATSGIVRERVAGQLEDLLQYEDRLLLESVEALGSYVLPARTRRWVTGLHRRMTRLDWGA